jgi:SSS family solute:Na+ symporter
MLNSTATLFTMDIYKPYLNKKASEKQIVMVGRLTAAVALVIAGCTAPFLGNVPQMFQYIQEYTGIVSPGVLAVFLMGLFWKKSTGKGAIIGVITSIPVALLLKTPAVDMPWMDQMFYTMLITMLTIALVSMTYSMKDDDPKSIHLTAATFKTGSVFNLCAYCIIVILAVLYALFW